MDLDQMLEKVYSLSEGDYAECGVWKGEGAEYILKRMAPKSCLWLFDSFLGHAEPGEFDDAVAHPRGRYADTSIEEVRQRIGWDRPTFMISGWIPQSLNVISKMSFRFVRVDLDHYFPTKAVTEFFRQRMVRGGIMQFDDYRHAECPGATKAIDEVIGKANIEENPHWINNG